ncbi:MAG: hypothetical protein CMJ20_13080 [Phycisphaeraceae bacterium]|nr:hypothetical protein [Phycisphaeraceae bacterium]
MTTQLQDFINNTLVIDTHEHLRTEHQWVEQGPLDVLQDLFANYTKADLISGGASPKAARRLDDGHDPDIKNRWNGIAQAWENIRHTGYGQSVQVLAQNVYGIEEITPDALHAAQPVLESLRCNGQRLHLLHDVAKIDHVQIDDKMRTCHPDESGPDFFLSDISWVGFVSKGVDWDELEGETGICVKDLRSLRSAMEQVFARHAQRAIAVKTQHAYNRTLRWRPVCDEDADRALNEVLTNPGNVDQNGRLCLGDWCLAQAAQLAGEYHLPLKIHTGYYAGNNSMITDRIRAGHLCPLLIEYPNTRFVLMHIAYPYTEELVAMTKHFPNAWADLCWAWSVNPAASGQFVRHMIHAAPANKLSAFGGDTHWPTSAYAYCLQMRHHLARTLQAEIDDRQLTESQAIAYAQRIMFDNQVNCFEIDKTKAENINEVEQDS